MLTQTQGIHATTVLQALVNLKRPTLLLQQLELQHPEVFDKQDEEDISAASTSRPTSMVPTPPLHSLKFNYDAMTPLVNISLSIYPTPPPVIVDENGKEAPSIVEQEPKTVYSGVHGGGFNQTFQLPAEAALDLSSAITPMSSASNDSAVALSGEDEKLNGPGGRDTQSEDTHRSSVDRAMGNLNIAQPDLATVPELQQTPAEHAEDRRPRRFGIFPRRGHRESDPEQGQIELQNRTQEAHEAEKEKPKEPEMGLRLLIRIEAVGPEGGFTQTSPKSRLTDRASPQAKERTAHPHPHHRHVGARRRVHRSAWSEWQACLDRQSCPTRGGGACSLPSSSDSLS